MISFPLTTLDSLDIFFKLYEMLRTSSDYSQLLLTGLAQLVSIHGNIFPDNKSLTNYASKTIRGLLPFMRSPSIRVEEITGISQVFVPCIVLMLI